LFVLYIISVLHCFVFKARATLENRMGV